MTDQEIRAAALEAAARIAPDNCAPSHVLRTAVAFEHWISTGYRSS